MRTLYLDPVSGIAGDMFLGLLFDLGVDAAAVTRELDRLGLSGYRMELRRETRCGISGSFVDIAVSEPQPARTWLQIDTLIAGAGLAPADADLARRLFRRLGEAEAKIHAVPLEQVHFHEVGAVDSILDLVGAAVGLNRLGVDRVVCGALPLGTGQTTAAHGHYPLPAPATLELLGGCPIRPDDSGLELVTPTGAVIAAEVASFDALPAMTLEKTGYGLGSRDLPGRPNVLRGLLGSTAPEGETDTITVLETHLDDCNPEWLGALLDELLAAGALDVAYSPLQMKKNRPGVRVTVLAAPADAPRLEERLLLQSSAIGVRRYDARRRKLRRELAQVTTELGEVSVKCLYAGARLVRVTPEYASCHALAAASGRPLPEVYRLAERAADHLFAAKEG